MGKKKTQQPPRCFETESGVEFIVGRDRYQNDDMANLTNANKLPSSNCSDLYCSYKLHLV